MPQVERDIATVTNGQKYKIFQKYLVTKRQKYKEFQIYSVNKI